MIHKAWIEIEVDTEREKPIQFGMKFDPKIPANIETVKMEEYPAAIVAYFLFKTICDKIEMLEDKIQPDLFEKKGQEK